MTTNFKPKPVKLTKCKICRTEYRKWSISQKTCSNPLCALELVKLDKEKKQRKADKAAKVKIRSKAEWIKRVQLVCNAVVRKRDELDPCISCQRHHQGQYHAGHYLSAGAHPALRFELDNIHKQCAPCNNYLSGNISNYRPNLIAKIGLDKVEWLEGPHEPKKYTIPELQELEKLYKQKLKELTR